MISRLGQVFLLLVLLAAGVGAQKVAPGGVKPQNEQAVQGEEAPLTSEVSGGPSSAIQAGTPELPPRQESLPHADLEKELTKLAAALNARMTQPDGKSFGDSLIDFLSKLAALVATIIGCIVSYKGLKKVPAFNENKEIIALILGTVVLAVVFYLLSGLVTSVLNVLIAIIVLLIALALATAHLLKFIDEKYPDAKDGIISYFSGSSERKSVRKAARDNIRAMQGWLEGIVFFQKASGEITLDLVGSFVAGYDASRFIIEPDDSVCPHWKNVEDRLLVPVRASLIVANSQDGSGAEVVNVQTGVVVVRSQGKFEFKVFDYDGQKLLSADFLKKNLEYQKVIAERMQKWSTDLATFNSQSL